MKTCSKLLALFALFTLGAYVGAWTVPHNFIGEITTNIKAIIIIVGALVGLFLGGLAVLLWD